MDALSEVLRSISIRGSVFCHGPVSAPWRFRGGSPDRCLFHAVVEGEAWLELAGDKPRRLTVGDLVLIPRGGSHRMGSQTKGPATPLAKAVEHTDDDPFARFCIGGEGPSSHLICGSFVVDGLDWHPLLRALPELIVVNTGTARWLHQTVASLERYLNGNELGADLVTARLTEILFVQAIASWLDQQEIPGGWVRALRDDRVGRALGLIHRDPGRDWGVPVLARSVGMSRSALFTRFKNLVGVSPARYIKKWRMTLAARALATEDTSIQQLSERLGYKTIPAFTHAFRQEHGTTPAAYRRS